MRPNVDQELDNKNNTEDQIQGIGNLAQPRRRSVSQSHLASILRLKNADQEVLQHFRLLLGRFLPNGRLGD